MNKFAILTDVTQSVKKKVRSKARKSLQTLQLNSADDETRSNMIRTEEKDLLAKEKKSKMNETVIVADKENAPVLRRSKRKPTVTDTVSAPEDPKPSKSGGRNSKLKAKKATSKSKKGTSTTVKKNEQKIDLSQSKLNFSPIRSISPKNKLKDISESNESEKIALGNSITSEVTEDSGFVSGAGTSQQISPSIIFKSPFNKNDIAAPFSAENSILSMDSPPDSYWKEVAEQRRFALEKALHENELLHDQVAVLEAENSQLKQLVKEAEELARVVKGIIE